MLTPVSYTTARLGSRCLFDPGSNVQTVSCWPGLFEAIGAAQNNMKRRGTPFHTDILRRFTFDPQLLERWRLLSSHALWHLNIGFLDVCEQRNVKKAYKVRRNMMFLKALSVLSMKSLKGLLAFEYQTGWKVRGVYKMFVLMLVSGKPRANIFCKPQTCWNFKFLYVATYDFLRFSFQVWQHCGWVWLGLH